MSITKTRNLLGAVIFIILTAANAWGAGFTVQAPAAPQIPGNTFDVAILMDAGSYRVKSYRVKLLYDGTINKPLYAVHGDHPDFLFPMTNDVFFGSETKLVDFNKSYPDCSSGIPLTAVAAVKFLALEGAPSSSDATIKIVVEEVIDCSNNDVTSNFRTNFDGSVAIAPPVSGPTGVTQYLDLDGNGVFDYNDTVMMGHIVSGDLSNTYEMPFNIGGMQGDINGNGQVDFYDVGLMNAMSRDIVFCSTGFDGIAETLADPTDEQVIMPGQGKPNSRCISAGTNQVLESTVAGDDYEVDVGGGGPGNWMSSGLDGICDSLLSGDDVEEIPNGRGAPYSEMIKPGQDGELATPCDLFGDDQSHVFSKSVETLLNGHPVMGRPARLVKVSPTQEPVRIKQYNSAVTGTSVIPPVPLVVRIEDENGNPKPGLSPTFAVTMGSGVFDGPLGQTGIVDGVPSDGYMGMGQVPKGTSVVVFHPTLGINRVQVILPPDPTKGVPSTAPVIFDVVVDEATSLFPNIVTIQADTHNANLGEPVPVTINLANNTTPVPGLQDRIILLSQRNISAGFDADPTGLESPTANFMDDFENTVFPESPYGTWDVVGASINRDNSFPGLFGNYSLHIIGKGISNPISITHQVNNKNYYGIELSYEWSFLGITEDYDYFKVEYSTDNGVSWRTVQMAQGQQGLHCPLEVCDNVMVTEKRNLRGDDSADENSKFMIRFTFAATDAEEFWLDNVSVKGIHILWDENFESQAVGSPPTGFDSVDRITTGPDGIAQSAASGGDVQIIPVGQGKANEICIFPGLNNICDSTAGGDDQLDGAAGTISTGFNGICESTAVGDDFQLIPGGQGKPHTVAVAAGNDLYVDTPPGGDDELFTLMERPRTWWSTTPWD